MTPNFYSLSKSLRHHENLTAGGGDSGSMSATGATETTYTDSGTEYTVQTWTSSGSFDITGTLTVDMLVVAGGRDGRVNIANPTYIYDRDRNDFIIPKPNSNEDPFFDPEVGYIFEETSLSWVNPNWP